MQIGRIVGKYRLAEVLGQGAFATVYKATAPELPTAVALKVLAENWSQVAEVRSRFENEASVLYRLSGPGIVAILDYGITPDDRPYLAMSLADKGTLEKALQDRSGRPFDLSEATKVIIRIAQALEVAHRQRIVHRDLKPANVLFQTKPDERSLSPTDHTLMVADFGLARALSEATRLTTIAAGTYFYMAPEQFEQRADLRCDIYAMGVIYYEMLAGRLPFAHTNPMSLYRAKVAEDYVRIRDIRSDVPQRVAQVIDSSLAADASYRPSSSRDWLSVLVQAFESFLGTAPPEQHVADPVPAQAEARRGLLDRLYAIDQIREWGRWLQTGSMNQQQFEAAKERQLREVGLVPGLPPVQNSGLYAQLQARDMVDRFRQLAADGLLSPAELGVVRQVLLSEVGLL